MKYLTKTDLSFVTDRPCLIPALKLMVYFLYESPMGLLDVYKLLASLAEQTNTSVYIHA